MPTTGGSGRGRRRQHSRRSTDRGRGQCCHHQARRDRAGQDAAPTTWSTRKMVLLRRRGAHPRQERGQGRPARCRPQHQRVHGDGEQAACRRQQTERRVTRAVRARAGTEGTMTDERRPNLLLERRPGRRRSGLSRRWPPRAASAYSARHLAKHYRGRTVLRDVSLTVHRGEAVGLLGPNGAGKTTCFYIITGLIAADGGQVLLDDQDITRLPMYRRARLGIGYLPQEASIFRGLNVEDNIRAVLRDRRARAPPARRAARAAARRFRADPSAALAGAGAVGRRAPPGRDRPRAGRGARASSCSTSRWPASTRSMSARSATWSATSRIAASAC